MLKNRDVIGRTNMENYNYGLMIYTTTNIGDEIQSIAASRFLPSIDEYISRENIKFFKPKHSQKLTKVIMNAWWMWKPKNFPPSKYIRPLLISMHIQKGIRKNFLTKETKDYLITNGPVGCRDMDTCRYLQENNIPAYFSGCLTLTLKRNPEIKRQDYILCIDVSPEIEETIKKRTSRKVINISRLLTPYFLPQQKLRIAKLYLRLIHNAHCVVSSRIHAILPSLALKTPVLRIIPKSNETEDLKIRIEGMENFVDSINEEDFINNTDYYNFENPPQNRQNHIQTRQQLIEKCKEFTGYDCNKPTLENEEEPLLEMFDLLKYSQTNINRILYFAHNMSLVRCLFKKLILKINRYNI